MFISPEKIEQIREAVSIEEIILKYVPSLKKKGKDYLGLCPFHKEKTPSFSVVPEKNMFYCFGCHAGGNVFNFISKMENLNFVESVKFVGSLVGIEVQEEVNREEVTKLDLINRLNNYALNIFSKALKSPVGKKGLGYILGRGVTKDSLEKFKIGYALDSWDFLLKKIEKQKVPLELAEKIGLISLGKKKNYYDKFRHRIIFPIFDANGRVVAFGGRSLGDEQPKYLNSPESEVFKKRNMLYGLNFAKKSMRDLNRVIVVEGYLDVIGCHQVGLENVVAPLGTALTANQLKLLSRYCSEVIFLFDADSAGIRASLKSIDLVAETNLDLKIAILPEKDPFDFVLAKGGRELMAVIDSAVDPIEFQINEIIEKNKDEKRLKLIFRLFKIISQISFQTERNFYLKKISALLAIDEKALRTDYDNYLKKNSLEIRSKVDNKNENVQLKDYEELLKLLCLEPSLLEMAVIDFRLEDFPVGFLKKIFSKLVELYKKSGYIITIDKMFDFFREGDENNYLVKVSNSNKIIEDPQLTYSEIYTKIKLNKIDQEINKYAELIQRSDHNYQQYLTEIEVLRREKEKFLSFLS